MNWNEYFLHMAAFIANGSKDPSTKVGVVVVGPDNEVVSTGFNGFPRGVNEEYTISNVPPTTQLLKERWEKRPNKYQWIEHAERNAIYNAARIGVSTKGCTMYFNTNGCPCADCTRAIIQAGITGLVMPNSPKFEGAGLNEHYFCDSIPETMLREAEIPTLIASEVDL